MEKNTPRIEPPNLIPDEMSPEITQWLHDQLQAERDHSRLSAARAAIRFSKDPRNIRAR